MKFETFKKMVNLSKRAISRELFLENRERIKIKKEGVAVKNLEKIFEAALTISNKKGFSAMSLRELSSEAGLSMGALYTYFSSKEELLDMLQAMGRAVTMRTLIEQISDLTGTRERLRRAIQAHLYLSEVMQPWFYFAYMETKNLNRQEHKKALSTWEKVVDVAPQFTYLAYQRLEDAYSSMANPASIGDFLKEIARRNSDAFTQLALARYLYKEGDADSALDQLNQAINLVPSFLDARKLKGKILLQEGRNEEAVEAYRDLLSALAATFRYICRTRPGDSRAWPGRHGRAFLPPRSHSPGRSGRRPDTPR